MFRVLCKLRDIYESNSHFNCFFIFFISLCAFVLFKKQQKFMILKFKKFFFSNLSAVRFTCTYLTYQKMFTKTISRPKSVCSFCSPKFSSLVLFLHSLARLVYFLEKEFSSSKSTFTSLCILLFPGPQHRQALFLGGEYVFFFGANTLTSSAEGKDRKRERLEEWARKKKSDLLWDVFRRGL